MKHTTTQSAAAFVIDDDWRAWLAHNLSQNVSRDALAAILRERGASAEAIRREIDLALASPYFRGAAATVRRDGERIKKYNWLLDIFRKNNDQRADGRTVPRRHQLSREEFFADYYFQNRPVIITGMVDHWPALAKWSLDELRARFGAQLVEVQTGRTRDRDYEINTLAHKETMPLARFVDMIATAGSSNDFYMTANNGSVNRAALAGLWDDIGDLPAYMDSGSASDGFLWVGPKGTLTPFHHDLTNNVMVQIVGRKRVLLVPAYDYPNMYNYKHCYSEVNGGAVDFDRFPLLRKANVIDCEIGPGEILFLPVGWWHYVESLDVSITVSMINFLANNDHYSNYETYHDL
jgi:hypothetical protein